MQMAEGSTLTGELFEDVAFPAISLSFLLVSILPVCRGATLMNWGGSGSVPIVWLWSQTMRVSLG